MNYYVMADVHGFYTETVKALEDAGYFNDTSDKKIIICGDIMDRGNEAVKMQDFVLDLLARDAVVLVRGNHEDLFLDLIDEDGGMPYGHHRSNGTFDTALQLTGLDKQSAVSDLSALCTAARKIPFYTTIIPSTVNYFETPNYVFVHGWLPVDKVALQYNKFNYNPNWRNAAEGDWYASRWINGMEASLTAKEPDKTVVCGHWHASYGHSMLDNDGPEFGDGANFTPYRAEGVLAIDACTSYSHFVNCVLLAD